LGRRWQFDWKAVNDGFRNRFTIVKDGKTITLVPLSPKQVYDDQIKLKKKSVRMGLTSDSDCMKKKQSTNVLKP
jgi:hypothetical protein